MEVTDIRLFLKYSLPCASTLIRRGLNKAYAEGLIYAVANNGTIPEGCEKIFDDALMICESIAQKRGKTNVDEEVIRHYFLKVHPKFVDVPARADVSIKVLLLRVCVIVILSELQLIQLDILWIFI